MKHFTASLLALALFLVLAGGALADDLYPPAWRGDILTVQAEWEFAIDFTGFSDMVPPDVFNTIGNGQFPFGDCVTHSHLDTLAWQEDPAEPGDGWMINLDDHPHVADFVLENWVDDYEFKHIWIQITWGGQIPPMVVQVLGPNPVDGTWVNPALGVLKSAFDPDPANHVEYWTLMPNPDCEHIDILIPPGTWVDEVVIDTICTQDEVETRASTWGDVKALFR